MDEKTAARLRELREDWIEELSFWIDLEGEEASGRVKAMELAISSLNAAVFDIATAASPKPLLVRKTDERVIPG